MGEIAGLEETGGVWKRMRLTRKTNSSQLGRFRDSSTLTCTAGGGKDFLILGKCMVSVVRVWRTSLFFPGSGWAVERGGRFPLHPHEAFPRVGLK